MKISLSLIVIFLITACSPKINSGKIGNYQVLLKESKANFYVEMLPGKRKLKKSLPYFGYKNNSIHSVMGQIMGKPLHGNYEELNFNGQLVLKGQFNKGLKNGTWLSYNSEGFLTKDLTYKNGDTVSVVNYYNNVGTVINSITPSKIAEKEFKKVKRKQRSEVRKVFYKNIFTRKNKPDSLQQKPILSKSDSTKTK
jgi:antitoxin component YwqK of YwqJK toxin-antitoxin module